MRKQEDFSVMEKLSRFRYCDRGFFLHIEKVLKRIPRKDALKLLGDPTFQIISVEQRFVGGAKGGIHLSFVQPAEYIVILPEILLGANDFVILCCIALQLAHRLLGHNHLQGNESIEKDYQKKRDAQELITRWGFPRERLKYGKLMLELRGRSFGHEWAKEPKNLSIKKARGLLFHDDKRPTELLKKLALHEGEKLVKEGRISGDVLLKEGAIKPFYSGMWKGVTACLKIFETSSQKYYLKKEQQVPDLLIKGMTSKLRLREGRPKEPVQNESHTMELQEQITLKPIQSSGIKGGNRFAKGFSIPPVTLLDSPTRKEKGIYEDVVSGNKKIIQKRLLDFGIKGRVLGVQHGPVVSVYEFEPAPGIKVNRIVNLADDLALVLNAISIRIVAPIPGKSVVGIEIPNIVRETVFLREVIDSDAFRAPKSKLPFALGMDISGRPYVIDFSRMPHLLVAGSTGSGKSVSINSMICSIIFKATPDEVRFVMIDPKMQELSDFDGIRHLLLPVVTNPKKAAMTLQWLVEEMERRYTVLAEKGVRSIEHYHQKAAKAAEKFERLPYIVVVVDELADLMMIASREAEESITRLAQMAKVIGIHLLLATQRLSVDVLTGIIKANFPARIAFQVTSKIDSRTILDTTGAERLLGSGDMLFLPPGSSKVIRLHGAFISSQEVKRIVEFFKKQGKPSYLPSTILEAPRTPIKQKEYDEKYEEAVAFVAEVGEASISLIQRRFRIGYNRAVRIVEKMEEDGIVGRAERLKPLKVMVRKIG